MTNNSSSNNNADNALVSSRARGLNKTAPTENYLTNVMNWIDASEIQDSLESLYLGDEKSRNSRNKNSGTGDEGVEAGRALETRRLLTNNGLLFAPEERRDDQVREARVAPETPRTRPFAETPNGFSPLEQRDNRTAHPKEVQTIEEEPQICGGDTISNYLGATMTLAFAWEGSGSNQGKRFGLTCAHLIDKEAFCYPQGRNVYLITKDNKHGRYSKQWIGKVVHFDFYTDSMVFEFHEKVKVKLNKIKVNPRSEMDINISDALLETCMRFTENDPVLAFGAQTRGAIGRVNNELRSVYRNGLKPYINPKCFGVWSTNENDRPGSKLITKGGDCGMIYINDQGIPIGMHHGASEWRQAGVTTYLSWVLPLDEILQSHSKFFGLDLPPQRPRFAQVRYFNEPYRGENLPVIETVNRDEIEQREDFVEIVLPNFLPLSDFTPDHVEVYGYGSDDDDQD